MISNNTYNYSKYGNVCHEIDVVEIRYHNVLPFIQLHASNISGLVSG